MPFNELVTPIPDFYATPYHVDHKTEDREDQSFEFSFSYHFGLIKEDPKKLKQLKESLSKWKEAVATIWKN